MRLELHPAFVIVVWLQLLRRLQAPVRHSEHQATLKHECETTLSHLLRLQLRIGRLLERGSVGAMRRHDVVQARARCLEAAPGLGIVLTAHEAHELGHGVAVIPGGTESVFLDEPPGRENNKVSDSGAWLIRRTREHGVNRWIWVVEGDAPDDGETTKIVFVRIVWEMC